MRCGHKRRRRTHDTNLLMCANKNVLKRRAGRRGEGTTVLSPNFLGVFFFQSKEISFPGPVCEKMFCTSGWVSRGSFDGFPGSFELPAKFPLMV